MRILNLLGCCVNEVRKSYEAHSERSGHITFQQIVLISEDLWIDSHRFR